MTTSPQSGLTLDRWLAWFETVHPKRIDLRLDRFIAVLDTLGLRAPPYKVVTVAGTNGKGSCVAMLESIYWHAGYTVGTFTSPHLWRFNERIRIDGVDAADSELVEVFEDVARALGTVTLSYFEASFVAALAVFRRHDPDVVILEVGMGGRLDATNALDTDCAMIVSIDLDHREWLGETRAVIGVEKAGIVRSGKPVVIGDRTVPHSVLAHAAAESAIPYLIGRDFDFRRDGWTWRRTRDPDTAPSFAFAALRRRGAVRERRFVRRRRSTRWPRLCRSRTRRWRRASRMRSCAAAWSGTPSTASNGYSTWPTILLRPRCSRRPRGACRPPAVYGSCSLPCATRIWRA